MLHLFLQIGNGEGLFTIDETGNITVNGTIDAEDADFFSITVQVICFTIFVLFNTTNHQRVLHTLKSETNRKTSV